MNAADSSRDLQAEESTNAEQQAEADRQKNRTLQLEAADLSEWPTLIEHKTVQMSLEKAESRLDTGR
jgi:hypothetical protein